MKSPDTEAKLALIKQLVGQGEKSSVIQEELKKKFGTMVHNSVIAKVRGTGGERKRAPKPPKLTDEQVAMLTNIVPSGDEALRNAVQALRSLMLAGNITTVTVHADRPVVDITITKAVKL